MNEFYSSERLNDLQRRFFDEGWRWLEEFHDDGHVELNFRLVEKDWKYRFGHNHFDNDKPTRMDVWMMAKYMLLDELCRDKFQKYHLLKYKEK